MQQVARLPQTVRMLLYAVIGFGFGALEHSWPIEHLLPWQNALTPFLGWGLPVILLGWYERYRTRRWSAIYFGILCFWLSALAGFYIYELVWYQVVQPVWMNVPWPFYVAQARNQFLEWALIALIAGAILSTAISIIESLHHGSFIPTLRRILSVLRRPRYVFALSLVALLVTLLCWATVPVWQDRLLDNSWLSPIVSRFRYE